MLAKLYQFNKALQGHETGQRLRSPPKDQELLVYSLPGIFQSVSDSLPYETRAAMEAFNQHFQAT